MRIGVILLAVLAATPVHGQWTLQTSNTTADLRGIFSVGNGVAWASGTNGTVLRTEDGGYVWQSCTVPPGAEKLDFRGVQAFDANTAIVMSSGTGDLSRLYKTTDGCHSWKLLFTNPDPDGFWDAIQFKDELHGYLLGDPVKDHFALFHTSNGGTYWPNRDHDQTWNAAYATEGAFAASNSSLLAPDKSANGPRILFSTGDQKGSRIVFEMVTGGGDVFSFNWHSVPVPLASGTPSAGIFSLSAADSRRFIAVGGDYLKPDSAIATAAYSVDGAAHWSVSQTPPHGYRSAVAYDATSKTWITVGPNGTDISADDGKNWRALRPDAARHEAADADRNWNALSLPFVVGPHGRIGKLNDAALKH